MKTKDFQEAKVKEVTRYVFSADTLQELNDEDEYFQRWMLLTLKVICDNYTATDIKTNASVFLNETDKQDAEKLKRLLKKPESDDVNGWVNRTNEKIKKIIDGGWGELTEDGNNAKICKDVKGITMDNGKASLFSEFNVVFAERTTTFNS